MSQERCCTSTQARTTGSGSAGMAKMMKVANISAPTLPMPRHFWAVLLAGGDGIRLRGLTVRIVGDHRPKQFCPVVGAESLLRQTRARLDPLFPGDRQVFVVSYAHEKYYSKELADAKEYGGIEPGRAVSETQVNLLCRVNRFWEKPALPEAQVLLESGCLWNTFVIIGSAATFLELVCSEVPDVVLSITRALADKDLATTYARLPSLDFSRDILAQRANRLLVLRDSGSGWADLGSPDRVFGLLAKNVNQPARFRQTNHKALRSQHLRSVEEVK